MAATTALTLSGALGACTYETQRDVLTGAIAGGTVGLAQTAITGGDGDDYVSGLWQGAAIGAAAGAARGIAEEIADRTLYPGGSQVGTGYDDPYYDAGYRQQPVYGYPRQPVYGSWGGYPSPYPGTYFARSGYGYPEPYGYPDPYGYHRY